jgi:A/G-specific adenine glycosylase
VKHRQRVEHFRTDLLNWAEDNLQSFPWRDTTDPYEVLVAEILLQKTAAEKVEPIYIELLATYPSLNDLAEADRDRLGDIIYSCSVERPFPLRI